MIAWIDTETTGLSPVFDDVLEVALVLTTDDLIEVAGLSHVIQPLGDWHSKMNEFVTAMHIKNGLIDDIEAGHGVDIEVAERNMIDLIMEHCGIEKPIIAGSTVGYDKAMLTPLMPQLFERVHYRVIDVSTIRELVTRWNICSPVPKLEAHRALPDAMESISHLAYYRNCAFKVPSEL